MVHQFFWLVVDLPLWKILVKWEEWVLFPIYGTIKNVPNHQPVFVFSEERVGSNFSSGCFCPTMFPSGQSGMVFSQVRIQRALSGLGMARFCPTDLQLKWGKYGHALFNVELELWYLLISFGHVCEEPWRFMIGDAYNVWATSDILLYLGASWDGSSQPWSALGRNPSAQKCAVCKIT